MQLTNKAYNVLKPIALVWLPLLGTLYFTVAQIWNLPDATNVVGTITAVDTFLGLGLHVSSKAYTPLVPTGQQPDGHLVVDDSDPEKPTTMSLEIHAPPEKIATQRAMVLRVVHPSAEHPILDSPPIPGPHGG
jgi:hypothetical protein